MIIKLYDNEGYDYPLLDITENGLRQFKKDLKQYQKKDDYNFEEFIELIKDKPYFVSDLSIDEEVFF